MSKDEALEKWLEGDWWRRLPGPDGVRDHTEFIARQAWHAAVEHALAYVTTELMTKDLPGVGDNERDRAVARHVLREAAAVVAQMEP